MNLGGFSFDSGLGLLSFGLGLPVFCCLRHSVFSVFLFLFETQKSVLSSLTLIVYSARSIKLILVQRVSDGMPKKIFDLKKMFIIRLKCSI